MSDLISRQAAIEAIKYLIPSEDMELKWRYLHADPALIEWPGDMQRVLLTIKTYGPEGTEVVAGAYSRDDGWMIDYEDNDGKLGILAWMPMPEPYEEG